MHVINRLFWSWIISSLWEYSSSHFRLCGPSRRSMVLVTIIWDLSFGMSWVLLVIPGICHSLWAKTLMLWDLGVKKGAVPHFILIWIWRHSKTLFGNVISFPCSTQHIPGLTAVLPLTCQDLILSPSRSSSQKTLRSVFNIPSTGQCLTLLWCFNLRLVKMVLVLSLSGFY